MPSTRQAITAALALSILLSGCLTTRTTVTADMRLELIGPDGTLESTTRSVKVHANLNRDSIAMVEWFVSEDTGAASHARLETDAEMLGLSDDFLDLWDLRVDGVRSGERES